MGVDGVRSAARGQGSGDKPRGGDDRADSRPRPRGLRLNVRQGGGELGRTRAM